MPSPTPYGSWPSPIGSDRIAAGALRLSQPRLDAGHLSWLEGRPQEGGRQVLMGWRPGQGPREILAGAVNVRSRVHEYGGGDYNVQEGTIFYVDFANGGVQLHDASGERRLPGTDPGARYADFTTSPDGRWWIGVEERDRAGQEPENRLLAVSRASGARRELGAGHDFVSSPRFSPDGRRLAFLAWDHPRMPWDGTTLQVMAWGENGPAGACRQVAGGTQEALCEPGFSPAGRLTFVSDRSGWWNLLQERESGLVELCPRAAEFAGPAWVFGLSSWDFIDEEQLLCVRREGGVDQLAVLDLLTGRLHDLPLPYTVLSGLRVEGRQACFVAGAPSGAPAVCVLDLPSREVREVRRSPVELDPGLVSVPEALEFPTGGGLTAHAFLYRPRHPEALAPAGERPPLLVKCHGGPTAASEAALDLAVQFWTSRGFAFLDVNYGGSSGYGRAYRERLRGQWGVVDVDDCVNAARYCVADGIADAGRLAIRGGSAGGFTALCAVTFHDLFHAAASHYGIGDLEALLRDTHKFESRYLESLVGPFPERRDLYRERSPLHHANRISCPVIFFQGLEDRVVPPSQAEAMVEALRTRGIPRAYVPFPGEQHGFRRAESIRTALDGELSFYGRIFGFDGATPPPGVRFEGL